MRMIDMGVGLTMGAFAARYPALALALLLAHLMYVYRHSLQRFIRVYFLLRRVPLHCPACLVRLRARDTWVEIGCGDVHAFVHDACLAHPVARELRLAGLRDSEEEFVCVLKEVTSTSGKFNIGVRVTREPPVF